MSARTEQPRAGYVRFNESDHSGCCVHNCADLDDRFLVSHSHTVVRITVCCVYLYLLCHCVTCSRRVTDSTHCRHIKPTESVLHTADHHSIKLLSEEKPVCAPNIFVLELN